MALGDNGRPMVAQLVERYKTESEIVGRTPAVGLPAYAWPGGYPMVYTDEYNGTLCPDCASELERGHMGSNAGTCPGWLLLWCTSWRRLRLWLLGL